MRDLSTLYAPESVAIIGASDSPGKVGNVVVNNLVDSGYPGKIYPVNPKRELIENLRCYPSVRDIPDDVDLAVICIPAPVVPDAMRDCAAAGVKSVVVITAGFKEAGPEGEALEQEITRIADDAGINMMGPNCLGAMNTHTPINVTFAGDFPLKGDIAFFSQSGALCIAILDWSLNQGVGFSKFISMGNKAQLNEADFIADAAADSESRVILMYLESIEDGDAFMEAAREAVQKKPVIILKSGVSEAGAQAASSHTGALAGSDAGFAAAFRQSGIIRAERMQEEFGKATAFIGGINIAAGRRVAVVTNAGGLGVMATDALEGAGLKLAELSGETQENLRAVLPEMASVENPVDIVGHSDEDTYAAALETVVQDPGVDMILPLLSPTAVLDPDALAEYMIEQGREYSDIPMSASFTGGESVKAANETLRSAGIPCFPFPEEAVEGLVAMVEYGEARRRLGAGQPLSYAGDRERVREIFRAVRADGRRILLGPEAMAAARAYGISTVPSELATSAQEAGHLAEEMGFPVAMKVASPDIVHKTDIGGVKLDVADRALTEKAFEEIMQNAAEGEPDARVYGVEVQKMFPPGQELIVGMTQSPPFGPLLMFGLGGIFVDLMEDVSFRLARHLTDIDVDEMIGETKAAELLRGYRGDAPKDLEAVKETVGRVAQLSRDFSDISELDVNPFFAYEDGVAALDVKITLTPEAGEGR